MLSVAIECRITKIKNALSDFIFFGVQNTETFCLSIVNLFIRPKQPY